MGQIIEIDYQNRPQYLCRLYKDRVAFNRYRKCLVIELWSKVWSNEVTDPRNCDSVRLGDNLLTCLRGCMQY